MRKTVVMEHLVGFVKTINEDYGKLVLWSKFDKERRIERCFSTSFLYSLKIRQEGQPVDLKITEDFSGRLHMKLKATKRFPSTRNVRLMDFDFSIYNKFFGFDLDGDVGGEGDE